MPKSAKKSEAVSAKAKKVKESIPPDVFDDSTGVKVFIPDEELKQEDDIDKALETSEPQKEKENEEEREDLSEEESKISDDEEVNTNPPSFYEKVLGEKPPENINSEDSDDQVQKDGINRSLFFLGGIVFVMTIIIATGVGMILLNKTNTLKKINFNQEPTPIPTEIPTPTVAEISKEDFTFEVLNGSGESGKAGKTADSIKELGYKVENVGNADSNDYLGFHVGFSSKISDTDKKMILDELKKEFINAKEDPTLEAEDTDILVIIGK